MCSCSHLMQRLAGALLLTSGIIPLLCLRSSQLAQLRSGASAWCPNKRVSSPPHSAPAINAPQLNETPLLKGVGAHGMSQMLRCRRSIRRSDAPAEKWKHLPVIPTDTAPQSLSLIPLLKICKMFTMES